MIDVKLKNKLNEHDLSINDIVENYDELIKIDNITSYISKYSELSNLFDNQTLNYIVEKVGLMILYNEDFLSYFSNTSKNINLNQFLLLLPNYLNDKNTYNALHIFSQFYNNEQVNKYIEKFNKLLEYDQTISETTYLPLDVLSDEIISAIGYKNIATLASYTTNALDVLLNNKNTKMYNWINFISNTYNDAKLLHYSVINYDKLESLVSLIVNSNGYFEEQFYKNLSIIIRNGNKYNISKLEDIYDYKNCIEKYYACDFGDLESKKNQCLEVLFFKSLDEINLILKKYGLFSSQKIKNVFLKKNIITQNDFILLQDVVELITSENTEDVIANYNKLKAVSDRFYEIIDNINNYYNNLYTSNFNNNQLSNHISENSSYGNLDIYNFVGQDFDLLISVINAGNDRYNYDLLYSLLDNPSTWLKSSGNNTISCSYISERNMSVCSLEKMEEDVLIYGFCPKDPSIIKHIFQTDLGISHGKGLLDPKVDFDRYVDPEILKRISLTYNEIVLDRKDSSGKKYRPDFILVFDNNINKNVLKHATYWGIPIIRIDREKYLKRQENFELRKIILDHLYKIDSNKISEIREKEKTFDFNGEDLDFLYNIEKYINFEKNFDELIFYLLNDVDNDILKNNHDLIFDILLEELSNIDGLTKIDEGLFRKLDNIKQYFDDIYNVENNNHSL